MSAPATIREAGPDDVPEVHRLLVALATEIGDGAVFRSTKATLARDGFGERPHFGVLLAEQGVEAVGVAVFMPYYSTTRGEPGVYVQDLYLAPSARGRGLATRMLAAVMERARAWDAGFLRLTVYRDNEPAIGFYRRLGFGFGHNDLAARIDADALMAAADGIAEDHA
jgi:ribosomal protein S18 acetylase RimI-like enzyme